MVLSGRRGKKRAREEEPGEYVCALSSAEVSHIVRCLPVLIHVPGDREFSRGPPSCKNIPIGHAACPPERLVGMREVIARSRAHVLAQVRETTDDDGSSRVPPVAFSRMARGGKTTVLRELFDDLYFNTEYMCPIIITFNPSANFRLRDGETQAQAILRLVAAQLVDCTAEEAHNIVCDRQALDDFLSNWPVVLLADELSALGPLDAEAAFLLRDMFLDKVNRYFVFSSHFPMSVEVSPSTVLGNASPPSDRGVIPEELPVSTNIAKLRHMHVRCAALTRAEVALYGGIPSLIYSVKARGENTPEERFRRVKLKIPKNKKRFVQRLVSELLDGDPCLESSAKGYMFYMFASFTQHDKVRWPLCYVKCILKHCEQTEPIRELLDSIQELECVASQEETGLDWEAILKISLILRCLASHMLGAQGPFKISATGAKPGVLCRQIPDNIRTVKRAHAFIRETLKGCIEPTLLVCTPAYSSFPTYDGFIGFTAGGANAKAVVDGYQVKTTRTYPKVGKNRCLRAAHLLRGKAPASNAQRRGWNYLSAGDIHDLLDFSLGPLCPDMWPAAPSDDEFDDDDDDDDESNSSSDNEDDSHHP